MPDSNNPVEGQGNNPPTPNPTDANNGSGTNEIAEIKRQINSLSAVVRRVSEGKNNVSNKPVASDVGNIDQQKAEQTWKERLTALEAKQAKQDHRAKINSLKSEASSLGVPADRLDVMVNHLMATSSGSLNVNPDTDEVFAKDEFGQPKAVKDFVSDFLGKYEFFKAPVQTPNTSFKGSTVNSKTPEKKSIMDYKPDELAKLTPSQIKQLGQ